MGRVVVWGPDFVDFPRQAMRLPDMGHPRFVVKTRRRLAERIFCEGGGGVAAGGEGGGDFGQVGGGVDAFGEGGDAVEVGADADVVDAGDAR